ncbi:MAG: hypothetical protein QOE13_3350 [Gaiellaceae bacterium]|nr:hypothetical protein [Gaiellaceae bacterium]
MSTMRITLRRKFAVAGTALVAAVALPLQAGAAHAATPEEDLLACNTAAVATYWTAVESGTDFDLSAAIDDCVNTFLREMGIDPGTGTAVTPDVAVSPDVAATDGSVTDGSVNTGILGTADGVTDTVLVTGDAATG